MSRPEFESDVQFHYTQTIDTKWVPGSGANSNEWQKYKKIAVDPYAEGRDPMNNYKLLIAGIVPRPVSGIADAIIVDVSKRSELIDVDWFCVD